MGNLSEVVPGVGQACIALLAGAHVLQYNVVAGWRHHALRAELLLHHFMDGRLMQ